MCANAADQNVDGSSSIRQKTGSGVGARWMGAEIEQRRGDTMHARIRLCAAAIAIVAPQGLVQPQTARAFPEITVVNLPVSPPLDPVADVATWSSTPQVALTWDVQRARPMREQAVAHVTTDGASLLVRFDVAQREPVVQLQRTNDVGQGTDDEVWVDLWPSGPTGFQYQFFVTPNGTHYESSTENTTYAPHWSSFGAARAGGYTVTMRIPLDVMRGTQSSGSWRIQFGRYVRTTGEQAVWSYDAAQTNPDDPARAGSMQMAATIVHRRQARLATYVLGEAAARSIGGSTTRSGADVSIPVECGT